MKTEQEKRPLSAVIFDMDGLMFDTERIVRRAWDLTGPALGYEPLGYNILNTLGMNLKRRRSYFTEKYGESFPFETFTEAYRKISRGILEKEGIPLKPGLMELLEFLKGQGCRMAVATSSSAEHAAENLEKTGVAGYFQGVINGSQVQFSKPHPQIYQLACELLQADPTRTIALEDSPHGLCAAAAAGLMPVMVPDLVTELPKPAPRLEAKLASLYEVKAYIEKHFYFCEQRAR
ncbi:MAG: HAD family phosphatase [Candidatus Limivivens sp.]|nr:HAD family phosphatase [Candidatus Limivivens sp.]